MVGNDSPSCAFRRRVTKDLLLVLGKRDYVLAGSGAIIEQGLVNRLSRDIDLFKPYSDPPVTIDDDVRALRQHALEMGYAVEVIQKADTFAKVVVSDDGESIVVDLGEDAISGEHIDTEIGPILPIEEAVGSKVAALFSRGEVRDYIDFYGILINSGYTLHRLCVLAEDMDAGFTPQLLSLRLSEASRLSEGLAAHYGIDGKGLADMKSVLRAAAEELGGLTNADARMRDLLDRHNSGEPCEPAELKQLMDWLSKEYKQEHGTNHSPAIKLGIDHG